MSTFTMDYAVTDLTIDEIKPIYPIVDSNNNLKLSSDVNEYWFTGKLTFKLIPENYCVLKYIGIDYTSSNPDIYFNVNQYTSSYFKGEWQTLTFPLSVSDLESTYIRCTFTFPYAMWYDFLNYYNFDPFNKQLPLNNFTGYIKSQLSDDATATLVETQHKLKFILDSTNTSYSLSLEDNDNYVSSTSPTDSWKVITAKPQFIKCYRRPTSSPGDDLGGEFEIKLQLPYKIYHYTEDIYFLTSCNFSAFDHLQIINYEDNSVGTLITLHKTYLAEDTGIVTMKYSPILDLNNLNTYLLQFNTSSVPDYKSKIKKQSLDCLEFIEDSTLAHIKIQKGIRIWAKEFIEENNSTNTKLKNDITVVAKEFKEVF